MHLLFIAALVIPSPVHASTRYLNILFNDINVTPNITYGSGPSLPTLIPSPTTTETLKMDMYQPVGDTINNRIAIIWVHGGSFFFGDKNDMAETARDYAKRGYVAFSINYRMTDHAVLPDSSEIISVAEAVKHDILAAVRWVRAHASEYGVDPNRIVIGGSSAGAWSSLYAAYDTANVGTSGTPGVSSRVSAVISLSGGMRSADLGVISAGDPPLVIVHGNQDGVVPVNLPQGVYDRAYSLGIPTSLNIYSGGHNAFPQAAPKIREFLIAQLALPSSKPGDFNNDGLVNLADYNKLVSGYGTTYNLSHYNQLVANFGK